MIWVITAILVLLVLGILLGVGIARKLERKLDACLTLFRDLLSPPKGGTVGDLARSLRGGPPPPEEKTVFHLTPEHDAKVLGEDAE